jgi:putative membrane protein
MYQVGGVVFMFNGLSTAWSISPVGIVSLLVFILLYLLGLRSAARLRRNDPQVPGVSAIRMLSFFTGVLIFALLLFSPINTIGRTQLFMVHIAQIIVLSTVCAPLLLGGCPEILLRPVLTMPVVNGLFRFLTRPVVDSLVFTLTFCLFLIPKVLKGMSATPTLNDSMLVTIFVSSLFNWWPLIGSLQELRKLNYPLQILYVFFDGLPLDICAFVLVYSGVPLYHHYVIPPQLNLSANGDQTAAGALLLAPGLVDFVVMSPLFIKWLGQIEQKTRQGDLRRQQALEAGEYDDYDDDEGYEEDEDDEVVNEVPRVLPQ